MSQTLIQTVAVGAGGAASVDFTSIPATYTDLMLTYSLRTTQATVSTSIALTFNGSGSNFSMRGFYGNGSSATTFTGTTYGGESDGANATASTFSNNVLYIPNYSGNTNKSYSIDSTTESNSGTVIQMLVAGLWSQTTAINAISLVAASGTFVEYSSASLYGIKRTQAFGKPKATGGTITYADGYWYHAFTGSSTFTAKQNLTADVLVVAGGGSGRSGGGGAGGYRAINGKQLNARMYPVSVGAGSSGGDWGGLQPASGSASAFADIISAGGGDGGNVNANNAASGGSGGGSCGSSNGVSGPGTGNVPATTPPQGYNGGSWNGYANNQYGAGGGGALGVGGNSNATSNGGAGGPGAMWVNGATYSTGGVGMAANGTGASGAANTGNGGNGGFTGGSGGSGIVIVRYLAD